MATYLVLSLHVYIITREAREIAVRAALLIHLEITGNVRQSRCLEWCLPTQGARWSHSLWLKRFQPCSAPHEWGLCVCLLSTPIAEWSNTLPLSHRLFSFLPGLEFWYGHARKLLLMEGGVVGLHDIMVPPPQIIGSSRFSLTMAEKVTIIENIKFDVVLAEQIYY